MERGTEREGDGRERESDGVRGEEREKNGSRAYETYIHWDRLNNAIVYDACTAVERV